MKGTNTFIIFATFSRRFDKLHKGNNTMHLQTSVAAIRSDADYIRNFDYNPVLKTDKNIMIIRVYPDSRYFTNETIAPESVARPYEGGESNDFNIIEKSDNFWVVELTIEHLIGHLIFNKTSPKDEIMHQIFGAFQDDNKDAESISSNCLFEFRNGLNMGNIATLFKLSNIDISGGNVSNRGALKSTQFNLS
jgi:hypothetical protein